MIISRSIHVAANDIISLFFMVSFLMSTSVNLHIPNRVIFLKHKSEFSWPLHSSHIQNIWIIDHYSEVKPKILNISHYAVHSGVCHMILLQLLNICYFLPQGLYIWCVLFLKSFSFIATTCARSPSLSSDLDQTLQLYMKMYINSFIIPLHALRTPCSPTINI